MIFYRIVILLVLSIIPGVAQGGDDEVSVRARLDQILSSFPSFPYSNGRYVFLSPFNSNISSWNFPQGTVTSDLANGAKDILLFRKINGNFIENFRGGHFIESEFNGFSYSLSPTMASRWGENGPQQYVLIALQNLDRDGLFYNYSWILNNGEHVLYGITPTSETTRVIVEKMSQQITIVHTFPDVRAEMLVEELGGYSEVKVPVEHENVIAVLPASEFEKILATFELGPFDRRDLLKMILASPHVELPSRLNSYLACEANVIGSSSSSTQ